MGRAKPVIAITAYVTKASVINELRYFDYNIPPLSVNNGVLEERS